MAKAKVVLPYGPGEAEEPFSLDMECRENGSDKVYQVRLDRDGAGWSATCRHGKRGRTLVATPKTAAGVPYAEAAAACLAEIVPRVTRKGYVPVAGSRFGGDAAEVAATVMPEPMGIVPRLLNAIRGGDLEAILRDDAFVGQEKVDGDRRPVACRGGVATGGNKHGEAVPLRPSIARAVEAIGRDLEIDGEEAGGLLHAFDLLSVDGEDLRGLGFLERHARLVALGIDGDDVVVVPVHVGTAAKRAALEAIRLRRGEGMAFARADAPYVGGRPNAGGDHLKWKFRQSLSALVARANARRSVSLRLVVDDGSFVDVGSVTVPPSVEVAEGTVVEVSYRHANRGGGLVEPVWKGVRHDVRASECLASQRFFLDDVGGAAEAA